MFRRFQSRLIVNLLEVFIRQSLYRSKHAVEKFNGFRRSFIFISPRRRVDNAEKHGILDPV